MVSAVIVFYEIGKRMDFASNYRLLALLAFAGALLGNLPGFYLYTTTFFGYMWGGGFGYVRSFGFPEPSSIVNLLTSAVAAFMIPLAGLALAYFRFQRVPATGTHASSGTQDERRPLLPFFAVCFVVVLLAVPVGDLVYRAVAPQLTLPIPAPGIGDLVSGYAAFLIYPMLFLVGFFLMGRKLDPAERGPARFAVTVFIAAAAGLFSSQFLSSYISAPSAAQRIFTPSNFPNFVTGLFVASCFVVVLGFAAASLGWISSLGRLESLKGQPVDTPLLHGQPITNGTSLPTPPQ